MKERVRPLGLREDVETLGARLESKHARIDESEVPPPLVDPDVWARHLATAPWTQLSIGMLGALLNRRGAHEALRRAERGFQSAGDPFWLAASLLGRAADDGQLSGIASAASAPVFAWLGKERSGALENSVVLRADDASTLLHVICAREQLPTEMHALAVQMVRSVNHDVDRRLANLRAIAARRPSDQRNATSLRQLIWGAIASGSGPFGPGEVDDPRVDPATVFDPVTVAACVAVLHLGNSWEWLSEGPLSQPWGETQKKPRGWPEELALEQGVEVYVNYLDLVRSLRRRPNP